MTTYKKARSFLRIEGGFRDDRIFLIACDDRYAPEQYFGFLKIPRIKLYVVPTEDCTSHAKHVLNRLLSLEAEVFDERWMLLDTDHCIEENHFRAFEEALKTARQKKVKIALSKPCFEFWLALHVFSEDELKSAQWNAADEIEKALSARLPGGYNKTKLRSEHYTECVSEAFRLAKKIDAAVDGGDRPSRNTTRVYQLWESLMNGMSLRQRAELPENLKKLASLLLSQ